MNVGPMYLPLCQKMNDEHHSSSFGCHIAVGDVAPEFLVSGEGEVSLFTLACVVYFCSLVSHGGWWWWVLAESIQNRIE